MEDKSLNVPRNEPPASRLQTTCPAPGSGQRTRSAALPAIPSARPLSVGPHGPALHLDVHLGKRSVLLAVRANDAAPRTPRLLASISLQQLFT